MIHNETELAQATEQLARLYVTLAALRNDLGARNKRSYSLLAEGPLAEVERIRQDVDEFIGANELAAQDVDLWLSLKGERMRWRETPSSVLTAFLDAFRKGLQAIVESQRTGRFGVRPTDELKRACDLQVVELKPGSIRVALRLPEEARIQASLSETEKLGVNEVASALSEFVEAAGWVASGEPADNLAVRLKNPEHRRHVLRALKPFVPRPRGEVDQVELFGRLIGDRARIVLTRDAGARIQSAFSHAVEPQWERFEGMVREIDLDRRSFELRNIPDMGRMTCYYRQEMSEVTQALLGKKVIAVGKRRRNQFGELADILDLEEVELAE